NRLPVDILKVDRSFVMRMDHSTEDAAIVASIISLAHGLNMQVVAEGIETDDQRSRITSLGCEFGQGYHFSRPICFDDVLMLLLTESMKPESLSGNGSEYQDSTSHANGTFDSFEDVANVETLSSTANESMLVAR
ncbi:MAG: EAL domain-containing protein, partial [Planctomycetes bacterium]|nr:EAL domain-containing protein [Planctomycetota bacterium]